MKNYSHIGKSLMCRLVFVVICLYITSGCNVHHKSFYLVAHKSPLAQIWRVSPDNSLSSVVYEVAKSVDRPIGVVFPPEEIKKMQSYFTEQSIPITTTIGDLLPSPYISQLALSPTGEALAWVEGDTYLIEGTAIAFGVQRLMALDLNVGNPNVLLQMPLHAEEGLINVISGGPSWSPDGQRVAIIRGVRGAPVEASLIIVDASTGQSQEIAGTVDSGGPLVWDPDNSTIAWNLSRWHTRSSGGAIRFCAFQAEGCRDVEFDDLWIWNWSMDWSSDGKQVVFAAKREDSDVFSDNAAIGLHLLDPGTGIVQDLPVDVEGVLENPRWSPNGRLLAADYRPKVGDFLQSLLVIEPISGQIVSQLLMERAESSWVWGQDGHSILILLGTDRARLEVGILDTRDGSLQPVALPDELTTKQISYLNW